ncbi:hypothetical protein LTR78_002631 [Recurvomyces mirabilis]|uniref:Uncharacterized protein n=1 Tax=Recurvomyces mirabilis TaxID=574656 RepID=A0AAE0WTD8_9PEZI|nr:hypothetical protein LTR78_002631 [Recurvomyces mirabilis]KAK5157560.1 hypothetical protein LTS14_004325 [Recurvomyces mirabilis]
MAHPTAWSNHMPSPTPCTTTTNTQSYTSSIGPGPTGVNETPHFSYDELWDIHNNFLKAFTYPNNVEQAKTINSTLLAPNVIGRVDVTRVFLGQELNTEYLFGLFTGNTLNAGAATLLGIPLEYNVIHFAATDYVVSSATVHNFNFSSIILPVEIVGFFTYDSNKQISQYDVTFRRFDQIVDILVANVAQQIHVNTSAQAVSFLTNALASTICNTEVQYCNGSNQQYSDFQSCFAFLTQDIRFGTAYELGRNTLLCRNIHQYMVPLRPSTHCPHIGPSGGGYCSDDQTYPQIVQQPLFTNAPFVPEGKQNANATIAAW